ncbi:hypothetical protein [Chryseobacterium sp. c4a]|uniref:hypothetical protein n=1 Tax=Chryseobacterium sp. c4a TaxID=1573582 RepID=UPI00135BB74E|nr:hypothetical protein [Chryseobacterium sp. c4a]
MKKIIFPTLLLIGLLSFSCKEKKTVETKVVTTPKLPVAQHANTPVEDEADFAKDDTEYEKIDENSFKKWKGKYFLEYHDYAGEGNSVIKVKVDLNEPEFNNIWIWWEAPNEKNSDTISMFGGLGKADHTNTKIKFLPEVEAGEGRGMEKDYFLYEKNNKFYIKSGMIPSENGVIELLPIQKIK